jgi:hypothetical protein
MNVGNMVYGKNIAQAESDRVEQVIADHPDASLLDITKAVV